MLLFAVSISSLVKGRFKYLAHSILDYLSFLSLTFEDFSTLHSAGKSFKSLNWGNYSAYFLCFMSFRDYSFFAFMSSVCEILLFSPIWALLLLFQTRGLIWSLFLHIDWKQKPITVLLYLNATFAEHKNLQHFE